MGSDYAYTDLDNLPPNQKTCFEVFFFSPPSGWQYYQFEAPSYYTNGTAVTGLTVLSPSGSYNPTYGWYDIIGQIRNDSGSTIDYVQTTGTLYNASGIVIGCDYTYTNNTTLIPGQISGFDIMFSGRDYTDVADYRIQVDGQ